MSQDKEKKDAAKNLVELIKKIIAALFKKGDVTSDNASAMNGFAGNNPVDSFLAERVATSLAVMDKFIEKNGDAIKEMHENKEFGAFTDLVDGELGKDLESMIVLDSVPDELEAYPLRRSSEEQQNAVELVSMHLDKQGGGELNEMAESTMDVYKDELSAPPFSRAEELGVEQRVVSKNDNQIKNEYDEEMNQDVSNDSDLGGYDA